MRSEIAIPLNNGTYANDDDGDADCSVSVLAFPEWHSINARGS